MKDDSQKIKLRPTKEEDLEILFQFQLDEEGRYLAAFISANHADEQAYLNKYRKLLSDPNVNNQTIIVDDSIVGSVARFVMDGEVEITYWIDKKWWGRGVATKALREFLAMETVRPVFGRVAFDNYGSQKVLENCGFVKIGADKGFANARQAEIEELIYRLG